MDIFAEIIANSVVLLILAGLCPESVKHGCLLIMAIAKTKV